MSNLVDKFCWYDWIVIFIVADIMSAYIVAIMMMGAIQLAFILPLFYLAWLSYEDFRVRQNDKKRK